MSATAYEFYVRDSCGATDLSTWSGPYAFNTTLCDTSAQCSFDFDLYDSFGDGWNGGLINVVQSGVTLSTLGTNFTGGSADTNNMIDLCDGVPAYLIVSNPGAWSSEISFYATSFAGDTVVAYPASTGFSTGDTLAIFNVNCSFSCPYPLAPYTQSFDSASVPNCWSAYESAGSGWEFGQLGSADYAAANAAEQTGNGGYYAWIDFSSTDDSTSLESIPVDVSNLMTPALQFSLFSENTNSSDYNTLYVEAFDGSSWQLVDTLRGDLGGWQTFVYDISGFTKPVNLAHVRFRGESNGGNDFYNDLLIDDVMIMELPSCFAPSALGVVGVNNTSADVFWTTGGAANWDVQFGTTGFSLGSGTTVS
ncbi:unnamed protein product, partial [Symbiodinium sp. CCMP2456]